MPSLVSAGKAESATTIQLRWPSRGSKFFRCRSHVSGLRSWPAFIFDLAYRRCWYCMAGKHRLLRNGADRDFSAAPRGHQFICFTCLIESETVCNDVLWVQVPADEPFYELLHEPG